MTKTLRPDVVNLNQAQAVWRRPALEIGEPDRRYHQEDAPTLIDADYDAPRESFTAIKPHLPEYITAEPPPESIGVAPSGRLRTDLAPPDTTIIAFGDVHGCFDKLLRLFDQIEKRAKAYTERRHIVIGVGDLIDRGPDSASVLELVTEGIKGCETIILRGNHEQMMLDFVHGTGRPMQWPREGCFETLASYSVDARKILQKRFPLSEIRRALPDLREEFLSRLPPHHLNFLEGCPLHVTFGDYFFVHAGVRPYIALNAQHSHDLLWIRGEFLEHPLPFEKIIVHGHTPVGRVEFHKNRINLDTGACLGGPLSAVLFQDEDVRIFSP